MPYESPISIRKATEADFPEWLRMRKALWPEASYDELRDQKHLFEADNFSCFLAESNSKIVGFVELSLRPYVNGCDTSPVAFIEGIWVDENCQKNGIGRKLVEAAEAWAKSLSLKELASDTRIESHHSIHAHNRWGFEETERVVYFRKGL